MDDGQHDFLREAAHRLARVVVRESSDTARCEGFVEACEHGTLRISPISASVFDHARRVEVFFDDRSLRSFRPPRVVDAATLEIELGDARLDVLRSRLRRARGVVARPTVLVAPVGTGEFRTLTVTDVTQNNVGVDLPMPFEPGLVLPHVELFGDRGRLRPPSDVMVVESVPWVTFGGRSRFRVRMRWLGPSRSETATHDVVDELEQIARVLEVASLLDAEVDVEGVRGRLAQARSPASFSVVFDALDELAERRLRGPVSVAFDLFEVRYEARAKQLDAVSFAEADTSRARDSAPSVDRVLHFAMPLVLRRHARRLERRVVVRGATLRVQHPLTGACAAPIDDLSRGGLSFRDAELAYWPGLPLDDGVLVLRDATTIPVGDLEVRAVEPEGRVHAAFADAMVRRSEPLADLIARLQHPELTLHDGADLDGQLALYRQVGLLMGYMEDAVAAHPDEARRTWRAIHGSHSDVCRTLERREGDEVVASVSVVHAWDGSWLGQHLAARRDRRGCSPGTLLTAYVGHVLPRADCRNLVFFTTRHNDKINDLHRRFIALTGSDEAFGRLEIDVWISGESEPTPTSEPSTSDSATESIHRRPRRIASDEYGLFLRGVERSLGEFAAGALALDVSASLAETRRRFRRLGMSRRREIRVVDDGRPRVAVVHEHAPIGLCLPLLLSASWLVPLHLRRDERAVAVDEDAIRVALADVRLQPHRPMRLVITPRGLCPRVLEEQGLRKLVEAYLYVVNRAGLHRYHRFLTNSFGEYNVRASAKKVES